MMSWWGKTSSQHCWIQSAGFPSVSSFLTSRFPLVRSSPGSRPRELSPNHGRPPGRRGDIWCSPLCSSDSQRWCFLPLSAPAHRPGCRILPAREAVLWEPRHHPLVGPQSVFWFSCVCLCVCVFMLTWVCVQNPLRSLLLIPLQHVISQSFLLNSTSHSPVGIKLPNVDFLI